MMICRKCGNRKEFNIKIISVRSVRASFDEIGNLSELADQVFDGDYEDNEESMVHVCAMCGSNDLEGGVPLLRAFRPTSFLDVELDIDAGVRFPSEKVYISVN